MLTLSWNVNLISSSVKGVLTGDASVYKCACVCVCMHPDEEIAKYLVDV